MRRKRGGFTLVEMLVSIALVMLMMAIFAQAFGVAASAFKTSRGLAQNSQRARTLTTILQNDLDNRTFKVLLPFDGAELDAPGLRDFSKRRGYFYISENRLSDDADDVLQFTVELPDGELMYGKSGQLGDINVDTNQPDFDDGDPGNNTTASRAAEVAYFLRGGVLYRRVMLLRKPLQPLSMTLAPRDSGGTALIDTEYDSEDITGSHQGDFWNDFDLSAVNDSFNGTGFRLNGEGFSSPTALDNNTADFAIGKPRMRFGFCNSTGQPREYVQSVSPADFYIGRFTHEETSHENFGYPGSSASDPLDQSTVLTFNGKDHVVSNFSGGPRRAEDILMTNVYSFDVKVWDAGRKAFVDIGNAGGGDFDQSANAHVAASIIYGPTNAPSDNRVFDTWFPFFDVDNTTGDDMTAPDDPPFRSLNFGTDGQPGVAGVDDDMNGTTDNASEFGADGSDDRPSVTAIQITIRYHDRPSDQVKQQTHIQSLWPVR